MRTRWGKWIDLWKVISETLHIIIQYSTKKKIEFFSHIYFDIGIGFFFIIYFGSNQHLMNSWNRWILVTGTIDNSTHSNVAIQWSKRTRVHWFAREIDMKKTLIWHRYNTGIIFSFKRMILILCCKTFFQYLSNN